VQPKGLNSETVLSELRKRHIQDEHYSSGRILCSMCTKPHPIAKKAYELFFESNLGDPGLFPASVQLEEETVSQLAGLLNGKTAAGFIVSGGTEANLLALQAAYGGTADISQPEVILPQSAHFSFTKICRLLNLKPVYAPLDSRFRADPAEIEKLINKHTIAVVGTAGTAELGAVDPIEALSEIALRHGVHLHVDAAFGGLVIPFLTDRNYPFDFLLEGVQSLTVDPHKMGMAAVPAGGILFRNPKMLDALKTETPYLTDSVQYTFVGTRTGASAASAWAVFRALGRDGFQKIVADCMKTTRLLTAGIQKAGFNLLCEPDLNILAFRTKNTKRLAMQLQQRGWFVSYIPRYDCVRIVVMPHVKRRHAAAFLEILEKL
jgi:tyrosine decarboxylase/aspartate 1-decarboxylase